MGKSERRTCAGCGAQLAQDNPDRLCSPCRRTVVADAPGEEELVNPAGLGARIRQLRVEHLPPLTQRELADRAGLSVSMVEKLERGNRLGGKLSTLRALAAALNVDVAVLLAPPGTSSFERLSASRDRSVGSQGRDTKYPDLDGLHGAIDNLLPVARRSAMTLDSLEEHVARRSIEAVAAPPLSMIGSLSQDLVILHKLLSSAVSELVKRRLLRSTALTSALLAEELMVIGQSVRSRSWSRTALRLSEEMDDTSLRSLIGALGSRLPLYFGETVESIDVARDAGRLAPRGQASSALAPLVEALALAQLGDSGASKAALISARDAFDSLDRSQLEDGVFGLSERRFLFYESRALLDIDDFDAAWHSQEEALRHYPAAIVGDVAILQFDRARLLVKKGEISDGCSHAVDVLLSIPDEQRTGIFYSRAWKVFAAIPHRARSTSSAAELREVLAALPSVITH